MWDTEMKMVLAFLEEKRPESSGGVDSPGLCSPSCLLWSPAWLASSVTASPSSPQHPSRSLHNKKKKSREEIRSSGGKRTALKQEKTGGPLVSKCLKQRAEIASRLLRRITHLFNPNCWVLMEDKPRQKSARCERLENLDLKITK